MADKPTEKTKVIYNRGVRSIKYFHGKTATEHKYLAPGGQAEIPVEQANRLLNYEGIVDIKDAPKAQDLAAMKAALDKKADEVEAITKQLQEALAESRPRKIKSKNSRRRSKP